jgi:hypothetical protein
MRSIAANERIGCSFLIGAANYASSDQICSPHLHLMILMDFPLRESSNVWASVSTAPH